MSESNVVDVAAWIEAARGRSSGASRGPGAGRAGDGPAGRHLFVTIAPESPALDPVVDQRLGSHTIGWWRRRGPWDRSVALLGLAEALHDELLRSIAGDRLTGIHDALLARARPHHIAQRLRALADLLDPQEATP
jgi:hypothetical protein